MTVEALERRLLLWGNTGMNNIGEVLLPAGVNAQYAAGIDTSAGFGYFGPSHGSVLSMVNLNGPQPTLVSGPENMPAGVGGLLAIVVDNSDPDPANHFVYVGCTTGQILKMTTGDATHAPQVVATLNPTSASGGFVCGAIDTSSLDPAQHYAYFATFGGNTAPRVLRVKLSDFSDDGSETINMPNVRMAAIDTIHHCLYFSATSGHPEICKVNLTSFVTGGTSTATYDMSSTTPGDGIERAGYDVPNFDEGLVVDPVHEFAYLGTYNIDNNNPTANQTQWPNNQSTVVRVNLGSGDSFPAHPLSTIDLNLGERDLSTAQFDDASGNVYFGTDNTYPAHLYMIHVGDGTQPMSEVGRLDLNLGALPPNQYPPDGTNISDTSATDDGEINLRSSIFDPAHNAIYVGTDTGPGQIVKISVNGIAGSGPITLVQNADKAHIDWTFGAATGQLLITEPDGLTINSGGGGNTITLDYARSNPLPNILHLNGTFTIDNLAADNPLAGTMLEIGRSTVYVSYSDSDPLSQIRGYLKNGFNHGAWNGTAAAGLITSTPAAQNALQTTAIGYADSADGIVPGQSVNTIELKYTLYGDTTLAGTVGSNDFTTLTLHYHQTTGGTWDTGDFNYDGSIDFNDFTLLTRTYNTSLGTQAAPSTSSGQAADVDAAATVPTAPPPPADSSERDATQSQKRLPVIQATNSKAPPVHHGHPKASKKRR